MKDFRSDKECAREVFEFLLPDQVIRRQGLLFLANSVQTANRSASGRWSITLYTNLVLMNCGMIEVLQILPDQLHVMADAERLPSNLPEFVEVRRGAGKGFYRSVPSSVACDFDAAQASVVLPQLTDAHETLIQKASRTMFPPNRKNAHSPGVIEFLRDYLNQPLPQPAYFSSPPQEVRILEFTLDPPKLAEEIEASESFSEGAVKKILVNAYERDPQARAACIAHYGDSCVVCGMSFEQIYGEAGQGFIHVHHLTPLAEIGESTTINPITDLQPVCANCHAIIHRRPKPYTIEEVTAMIQRAKALQVVAGGSEEK